MDARKLRDLREDNDLTQAQLAELTGFSRQHIIRMESGKFAVSKKFIIAINRLIKLGIIAK